MLIIEKSVKWVMLVSGVLTATMFYGVIAPEAILASMFGRGFEGELELMVVRSWSALIGLVGVMLIIGFIYPTLRRYSLSVAAVSKLFFVSLSFLYAQPYWQALAPALVMDLVVVCLALAYWFLPARAEKE